MRGTSWSSRTDRVLATQKGEELRKMFGGELGTLIQSVKMQKSDVKKFELQDYIDWFISGLSSQDKTIFTLYYAEDLTMEEIGSFLDLTESAICLKLKAIHTWIENRKHDLKAISGIDPEDILNA